ncbi:MAG: glycine cleavage system protein GcvH [Bacteroidota bacterium]
MEIPKDLKYTEEHEWVRIEEDGKAYIGITDFAQGELGELVYVEVDTVGETVAKGEVFGTVEAVKTTSDLYMPVDGVVEEFNSLLDSEDGDKPETVNESPYGEGWIIKISVSDPAQLDDLLDDTAYEAITS